jgi:hypothetical protein
MEVLFGEARELTAQFYCCSTTTAKKNDRRQDLPMCINLHTDQAWLMLYRDITR